MKKKKIMKKRILLLGLGSLFAVMLIGFIFYRNYQKQLNIYSGSATQVKGASTSYPVVKEADLAAYNGDDPDKPIYIGFDGYVYDVSKGREFYQKGGSYHDLAGKDSTADLKLFGGNIIKKKYPIVGILKK